MTFKIYWSQHNPSLKIYDEINNVICHFPNFFAIQFFVLNDNLLNILNIKFHFAGKIFRRMNCLQSFVEVICRYNLSLYDVFKTCLYDVFKISMSLICLLCLCKNCNIIFIFTSVKIYLFDRIIYMNDNARVSIPINQFVLFSSKLHDLSINDIFDTN